MKTLLVLLILATTVGAQSYDRLASAYEQHPTEATYRRLMIEWHKVDRRNRRAERRLAPVVQTRRASADRFCDSFYDERKMRGK